MKKFSSSLSEKIIVNFILFNRFCATHRPRPLSSQAHNTRNWRNESWFHPTDLDETSEEYLVQDETNNFIIFFTYLECSGAL